MKTKWDEVFVHGLGIDWARQLANLVVTPAVWRDLVSSFVVKAHEFCNYELSDMATPKYIGEKDCEIDLNAL